MTRITADFTSSMCEDKGCYVSGSGSGSGSGFWRGQYFCDSALASACAGHDATAPNGTSIGCWSAIYSFYSGGNARTAPKSNLLGGNARAHARATPLLLVSEGLVFEESLMRRIVMSGGWCVGRGRGLG